MLRALSRRFAQLIGSEVLPATFTDMAGESKPSIGKAWSPGLLRLKSNEDLHKLWYVLLKEKNLILADKQLLRQHRMPLDFKQKLLKVRQSMARLLTVVRERDIEAEKYWDSLLEEYLKKHEPVEGEVKKKERKVSEDSEEWKNKKEKRKKAISSIRKWAKMSNKERRTAIQFEYAKQAKIAKEEFIKELRYVGLKLREKGIEPKPLASLP